MPKKIQEVTTALKLIRKFALVGQITPQLDETIVPVVLLDDLSDPEEWRFAFGYDRRIAIALEFNTWSLENPVGSGKVLEFLRAEFICDAAGMRFRGIVNDVTPSLSTLLAPQFQDLREIVLAATEFPVGQFRRQGLLAVFTGPEVWGGNVLANTVHAWTPGNTLVYPGARLFFQEDAANQPGECTVEWRERNLRSDGS